MAEEKRGPGRPPKQEKILVKVLRDIWDENAERVPAGSEIEVTVEVALDGVEAGSLARVKK